MPRPRKADRPQRLELQIPQSIYVKLQVELYSDLEGKVPHGAYSNLVTELFSAWLRNRGYTV